MSLSDRGLGGLGARFALADNHPLGPSLDCHLNISLQFQPQFQPNSSHNSSIQGRSTAGLCLLLCCHNFWPVTSWRRTRRHSPPYCLHLCAVTYPCRVCIQLVASSGLLLGNAQENARHDLRAAQALPVSFMPPASESSARRTRAAPPPQHGRPTDPGAATSPVAHAARYAYDIRIPTPLQPPSPAPSSAPPI